MLERMGITATVESAFEDGTMYVDVIGPEHRRRGYGFR